MSLTMGLTGHRPDKLRYEWEGRGPLSDAIYMMLLGLIDEYKPTKGICALAIGTDTIWARALLDKEVPFIAAIPFKGQEKKWSKPCQQEYHRILAHPLVTSFIVCDGGYAGWKMQKRNIWMVDHLDVIVGVYDGSAGGTQNCLKYAQNKVKEIIIINPKAIL